MFNFDQFYKGLISRFDYFDDYLDSYPDNGKLFQKEKIIDLYKRVIAEMNGEELKYVNTVACLDGVDEDYTVFLIELLKSKWHEAEEDLIDLLGDTKDERGIDLLFELSTLEYEWDENRSVSKKCIWALKKIGTTLANKKLVMLSQHDNSIIKETAQLSLACI